jgi:hypothetical protein
MPRLVTFLTTALLMITAPAAMADVPSQAYMDNPPPDSSMTTGSWADLPNGVAVRPYVKSLTVINGTQAQTVFNGAADAASSVQVGDVTAVVSPINLCRSGQASAPGTCYATPNRVGIAFGYRTEGGVGTNFANPSVPLRQAVTADTVFDVTIATNSLGRTLRWSYANGELVDWKITDPGTDAGVVRVRMKPAFSPEVDWGSLGPNGCTGTPIFNCEIARATSEALGSSLLLSLDETLDPALTGAVFATQGAIAGFLVPGGTPAAPTLDLQMASVHVRADGSAQTGVLQAFLPAQALINLYGVLPADASTFFTATRLGDAGTQDAPLFEARSSSDTSSDGLLVTIRNITFSAPTYRVARKAKAARVRLSSRGSKFTLAMASISACRHRACTITVYRTTPLASAHPTTVAVARSDAAGALKFLVSKAKLPKGSQYLVAVRRHGKFVTGARGSAG